MKRVQALAMVTVVAGLAACGQKPSSSAAQSLGGNDLQVTNKVVMSCQAAAESLTIKVRQFKDASGSYGSDSLYVVHTTDNSQNPAVDTDYAMTEADVLVPNGVYWLLLDGKDGNSSFDVRAQETAPGQLLTNPTGTLTVGGKAIGIYCQMGDVAVPGPILPTNG